MDFQFSGIVGFRTAFEAFGTGTNHDALLLHGYMRPQNSLLAARPLNRDTPNEQSMAGERDTGR